MRRYLWILAVAGLCNAIAAAQNPATTPVRVYLKEGKKKVLSGIVKKESPAGVTLGSAGLVPESTILDVDYSEYLDVQTRILTYSLAASNEKKAATTKDAEERAKLLKTAISKYEAALEKTANNLAAARRHIRFKIAYLKGLLASTPEDRDQAIKELEDFVTKERNSWQLVRATRLLADLLAKKGEIDKAAQQLLSLGEVAEIQAATKNQAALDAANLLIRGGKSNDARKILSKLIGELKQDDPLRMRAQLVEASALAAEPGKLEEAVSRLQSMLKEVTDKRIRAAAYNTLGECYYHKDMLPEARWQFLWVDVVYNDDPNEHAKALYYLWHIFHRLRDYDRAQEFYTTLVNGSAYAGSEWVRRAIADREKLEQ